MAITIYLSVNLLKLARRRKEAQLKKVHILVTGHTGFLGHYLTETLISKGYQVTGLSRGKNSNPKITEIQADLSDSTFLKELEDLSIDGIIHAAANGNIDACEKDKQASFAINVKAALDLVKYASNKKIPFVFTSSDQVFDGEKGQYAPTDEARPLNSYGTHKLAAEKGVLSIYSEAVVCRMPLMIGDYGGYEKALVKHLFSGTAQILFTDEIRSVLQAKDAAQLLAEALNWKGGLYHLPGPKDMNRYELGVYLAEKHGLDKSLLIPGKQGDVNLRVQRPKNATMRR
jgi:dTDP-4-dehydrorhamnose reductase